MLSLTVMNVSLVAIYSEKTGGLLRIIQTCYASGHCNGTFYTDYSFIICMYMIPQPQVKKKVSYFDFSVP